MDLFKENTRSTPGACGRNGLATARRIARCIVPWGLACIWIAASAAAQDLPTPSFPAPQNVPAYSPMATSSVQGGSYEGMGNLAPYVGKGSETVGGSQSISLSTGFPGQQPLTSNSLTTSPSPPPASLTQGEPWEFHVLPDGVYYQSYLAGVKEPRIGSTWNYENKLGWIWDITLGGRFSLLRYGTPVGPNAEGWEFEVEGAAFPRLDMEHERELVGIDFRAGCPLIYASGPWRTKLAYYHLCSHIGDQFILRYAYYDRTNYTRDSVCLGESFYLADDLRLYGEASAAFHTWGVAGTWEFQAGIDYSPTARRDDPRGSPFAALNTDIRDETGFTPDFVAQVGWQWRGASDHLFRIGLQYYVGPSDQLQWYSTRESKVGVGLWYDY